MFKAVNFSLYVRILITFTVINQLILFFPVLGPRTYTVPTHPRAHRLYRTYLQSDVRLRGRGAIPRPVPLLLQKAWRIGAGNPRPLPQGNEAVPGSPR